MCTLFTVQLIAVLRSNDWVTQREVSMYENLLFFMIKIIIIISIVSNYTLEAAG